jgi:RNA polymerase sigma-70 factor (ECF subfamily)
VLRICVNSAYDILRARARREKRETLSEMGREPSVPASIETEIPAAECQQAIQEAIGQLSRNQAVAVTMRLVQGIPYHDIGRALGCQESTVRKHVERGRQRLRELLRPVLSRLRDEEAPTC